MDVSCAAIVLYERHGGVPHVSILPFSQGAPFLCTTVITVQ